MLLTGEDLPHFQLGKPFYADAIYAIEVQKSKMQIRVFKMLLT